MSELPWTADEEPIILAFLTGEIGRDHPDLRQLIANRPELESVLEGLSDAEDDLVRLGEQERQARESMIGGEPEPASVNSTRRLVESELPPRPPVRRLQTAWVAAAAVALVALGLSWALDGREETPRPAPTPEERTLDGNEYEKCVIRPRRPSDPLDVFEWKEPPRSVAVEVRFSPNDGGSRFRRRASSETEWRPSPEDIEILSAGATWSVWLQQRVGPPRKWAEGRVAPR